MSNQLQTALIKGKPLKYRVRRSRRARKFGVQVCKREGVVIILPHRAGLKAVPGLLEGWADWLDAKVDQYDVRYGPKVRQFGSGSEVTILGRPRMLRFTDLPAGRKRPMITLTEDELRLSLSPGDVFDPRPVLEKYLRKLAKEDLNRRTRDWAAEKPDAVELLSGYLAQWRQSGLGATGDQDGSWEDMDDTIRQRLKDLGYSE